MINSSIGKIEKMKKTRKGAEYKSQDHRKKNKPRRKQEVILDY